MVADLPSDSALARPWLEAAGHVVLVCDQDFARLARVQAELESLGELVDDRWLLLVNRYCEAAGIPPAVVERAAGMRAGAVLPDCPEDVLPALKKGVPASLFSAGLRPGFRALALELTSMKGVVAFG
ncbi:MAG: hypothetical protein H5T97_03560 [Firmicutes bacterium]|nr:hypothetical protein [Bacillota bacterium]